MNVLLTPPTLEDTAQTRRPPAPTLWEAGPAPVTQVGKNGDYLILLNTTFNRYLK